MAGTSLPVARLLQLRVPIAWQEAVAVVNAADSLSAAMAAPITLEHCLVSTSGDVSIVPGGCGDASPSLSSLQLLAALLGGQASPADLRALVVAADEGPAGSSADDGDAMRLRVDLRWCLSADPRMNVAALAARGLAADNAEGHEDRAEAAEANPRPRPLVREGPRAPVERRRSRRRPPAVTVRVQRLSTGAALGIAAILLAIASGAAATGILAGSFERRAEHEVVPEVAPRLPATGRRERPRRDPGAEPIASTSAPLFSALLEPSATPAPVGELEEELVGTAPDEPGAYSAQDSDVEPPVLLRAQMPVDPGDNGDRGRSALEMVIDEHGRVLRVRLDSADPSLNDRMMVSAAKAWRFRPATRNGQAVAYVLRLPVTR